jgi:hypothetical protein
VRYTYITPSLQFVLRQQVLKKRLFRPLHGSW